MTSTEIGFSLSRSFNQSDFSDLIQWVKAIPEVHQPQNYSVIAIVFQQALETTIKNQEPQIEGGRVLDLAEMENPRDLLFALASITELDSEFLPFLNSEFPLRESISVTRTMEKVTQASQAAFLIFHTNSNKHALETMCDIAVEQLHTMQTSIQGSFNAIQVLSSSEMLYFPEFTNWPENYSMLHIKENFNDSELTVMPKGGLLLKKWFVHGECEKKITQLSFAREEGKIRAEQKFKAEGELFTDLTYEEQILYFHENQ